VKLTIFIWLYVLVIEEVSDAMSTRTNNEFERTLDQLFRLLADRHRRYTLYYLDETDSDVVTLEEMADYVTERVETNAGDHESRSDARRRVRVGLHHNHLPKLSATGLIDYDARTRTIRNWGEPSPMQWAHHCSTELPELRSLLCA
jgi:hypothetical protein